MLKTEENFLDEFLFVKEKFSKWKSAEQIFALTELFEKVEISQKYFLLKFAEKIVGESRNGLLQHMIIEANNKDVILCHSTFNDDNLAATLKNFLLLLSHEKFDDELVDGYRRTLIYFDSKIEQKGNSKLNEKIFLSNCEEIYFLLNINPNFSKILPQLKNLIKLIEKKSFEKKNQTNPMVLNVFPSEGSTSSAFEQNLRKNAADSGVDLSDNFSTNLSVQNSFVVRQNFSSNRILRPCYTETKSNHLETPSPSHRPLMAALSAPNHSETSQKYSNRRMIQIQPTLTKSDEEEETFAFHFNLSKTNRGDETKCLQQNRNLQPFQSLRRRQNEPIEFTHENVSQYLNIDTVPSENANLQWKPGMKDVPKWLKYLRLHKYSTHFSELTYEEMMNLTKETLKKRDITEGACSKILLHIQKLKERRETLCKALADFDQKKIDLAELINHLTKLMNTPIRGQAEDPEDLPSLIVDALGKVYENLIRAPTAELCYFFSTLIDATYRHEAFTTQHRNSILHWRGRITPMLQNFSRNEIRPVLSGNSNNSNFARRSLKTSVRPIKSSSNGASSHGLDCVNSNFFSGENQLTKQNLKISTSDEKNENFFNSSSSKSTNVEHQKLNRKPSINTHSESFSNKTKLCKTSSEPFQKHFSENSSLRFFPERTNQMFLNRPSTLAEVNDLQTPNNLLNLNHRTAFFDAENNFDQSQNDEQHKNDSEFYSFYRNITESVMSNSNPEFLKENSSHSDDSEQ